MYLGVALGEESVTGSLCVFSSSSSPDSMDVVFDLRREVKVDNEFNIIDIYNFQLTPGVYTLWEDRLKFPPCMCSKCLRYT